MFTLLGNKCVMCDWDDPRALQVDHKKAWTDNKTQLRGMYLYKALINGQVDINDYQLLCANHNWIKRVENRENRSLDCNSPIDKAKRILGMQFDELIERAKNFK